VLWRKKRDLPKIKQSSSTVESDMEQPPIADLERQLGLRTQQLEEAHQQQIATNEVLSIIRRSHLSVRG